MITVDSVAAAAPHWSPTALAVGFVSGYVVGAFSVALRVLRHRHRRPDPAIPVVGSRTRPDRFAENPRG